MAQDRHRMRAEMAELTDNAVRSVDEVAKLTAWLMPRLPAEGRAILTEREEEKRRERRDDQRGQARFNPRPGRAPGRVLSTLRRTSQARVDAVRRACCKCACTAAHATPAKFGRMLQQHLDGVLFGQYVFNGASQTGRASSKGIQVHNLARSVLAREADAIDTIVVRRWLERACSNT